MRQQRTLTLKKNTHNKRCNSQKNKFKFFFSKAIDNEKKNSNKKRVDTFIYSYSQQIEKKQQMF